VWSQAATCIDDPSIMPGNYCQDYDVITRYSDDAGSNWSAPVRVNDDTGPADQIFPSASLSSTGILHIAFLDHRNNPDLEELDVYHSWSADGATFSANDRISESPVPIPGQWRAIGDYLEMVVAYPDRVYVAYPCPPLKDGLWLGACLAALPFP
jgi:hypothetical protein